MPSNDIPRGNLLVIAEIQPTLTPASVANATSAEQTFAVLGLRVQDLLIVQKPTAQAGLGIVGSRVSASDVLAITYSNSTAATITPTAAESYRIVVVRASNPDPQPTRYVA